MLDPRVKLLVPSIDHTSVTGCGTDLYLPVKFSVVKTEVRNDDVLNYELTFDGVSFLHTLRLAGINIYGTVELDSALLRDMRLDAFRHEAMGMALLLGFRVGDNEYSFVPYDFAADLRAVVGARKGNGAPDLRRFSRLYSAASIRWPNPRDYIAAAFDVTTTTVSNWVRKAREAGFYVKRSEEEHAKRAKESKERAARLAQQDAELKLKKTTDKDLPVGG